uniref:Protein amnionless n=1 Tax=Syphacia muris TaxID=451379 RepID=A0A0N5AFB8_9BILA
MIKTVLLLFYCFTALECRTFEFLPSSSMNSAFSWDSGHQPCTGDRILFSDSQSVITIWSQSMIFDELLLPANGVIYFDNNVTIGASSQRQCTRRRINEGFCLSEYSLFDAEIIKTSQLMINTYRKAWIKG